MPILAPPRRRFGHAVRRLLPAVTLLGALAACGGGGDGGPVDPGQTRSTTRVDVTAQFVVASTTTGLTMRVTPSYQLAAGGTKPLTAATVAITSTAVQTLPVTLDVTDCLADPARSGADQGTGANAVCRIVVEYALLSGTRVVDAQTFGAYAVRSGTVTPQAVTFSEVTGVRVSLPNGTVLPDGAAARAEVGQTLALTAAAIRADGAVLAGRAVQWTSETPAVAQVNATTGAVTVAAPGQARVVASVGGLQSAVVINAVLPPAPVTVSVAGGAGSGTVTSTPAGISCRVTAGQASGTCAASFASDAAVTLTAVPDAGSTFAAWGGDCASAAGALTCQLTPSAARTASVTFTALRTLGVTLAGTGAGQVTSAPAGVDCAQAGAAGCTAPFLDGTVVTLTATPAATSQFAGWGGACSDAASTCTVTLDQARTVTATFTLRRVTLTLQLAGPGAGTVTATGTSVSNGTCTTTGQAVSCAVTADVGTAVVLTAAPDPATSVGGTWSGGPCTGAANTPCSFTATGDVTVATSFGRIPSTATPVTLSVSAVSQGGQALAMDLVVQRLFNGAPSSSGGFTFVINSANPPFTLDADDGTTVVLTVRGHSGSRILSWGGVCAGTPVTSSISVCRFTQRAGAAVTVNLGPPQ